MKPACLLRFVYRTFKVFLKSLHKVFSFFELLGCPQMFLLILKTLLFSIIHLQYSAKFKYIRGFRETLEVFLSMSSDEWSSHLHKCQKEQSGMCSVKFN